MAPNVPTRRTFGTDASLSWEDQETMIMKTASMAVTRLHAMIQTADESSVSELVRALSQVQLVVSRARHSDDELNEQITDDMLIRKAKK